MSASWFHAFFAVYLRSLLTMEAQVVQTAAIMIIARIISVILYYFLSNPALKYNLREKLRSDIDSSIPQSGALVMDVCGFVYGPHLTFLSLFLFKPLDSPDFNFHDHTKLVFSADGTHAPFRDLPLANIEHLQLIQMTSLSNASRRGKSSPALSINFYTVTNPP